VRPKVFHSTNTITCANSVLPTFMRHPGSFRPVSIANTPGAMHIVDTDATLEPRITMGVAVDHGQMNRTLPGLADGRHHEGVGGVGRHRAGGGVPDRQGEAGVDRLEAHDD